MIRPASPAVGALFDVGYGLMDESARLAHALAWLAGRLGAAGRPVSPAVLHDAYRAACRDPNPGEPSPLLQMLQGLGVEATQRATLRAALPWDAVPLEPYSTAAPALRDLRAAGFRVGILANQPASARVDLDRAGLTALCDGVWLSAVVGRAKPDPAFFTMALAAWGLPADRVAYVGDRPDNDVAPARALGLLTVRVLTGPHAAQPTRGDAERPDREVADLAEAVAELHRWRAGLPEV
ncbi:MAG TPA: HAD family hydrolase [Methylomirabilota bacterium]|nr:HAD family hydrolase [Methylomirabilota bacterium]